MTTSSFRHVYGEPSKVDKSYNDVNISQTTIDSNLLAANARFVAIPYSSTGGGVFVVLDANGSGKVGATGPTFQGHGGPVVDLDFNPFNDFILASAADDATIRIWQIESEDGKIKSQTESLAVFKGHSRRAARVTFNPVVQNALASYGLENAVKLWDVTKGTAVVTFKAAKDNLLDLNWSQDGNKLIYPAKDKLLHLLDIREANEVWTVAGSPGLRGGRAVFYDKLNYVVSTGYSQTTARQIIVRDIRKPETPVVSNDIDNSTGVLAPFIDPDTGVLFTFARGDTISKYYELRDDDNPLFLLSGYTSAESLRGFALAPKYSVDTTVCEIARFYVVTSTKVLQKIQMIVPRRNADSFQEDIYPPTNGPEPSVTFDEWKGGKDATPNKISLENGYTLPDVAGGSFSVNQAESEDPAVLKDTINQLRAKVAELEAEVARLKK